MSVIFKKRKGTHFCQVWFLFCLRDFFGTIRSVILLALSIVFLSVSVAQSSYYINFEAAGLIHTKWQMMCHWLTFLLLGICLYTSYLKHLHANHCVILLLPCIPFCWCEQSHYLSLEWTVIHVIDGGNWHSQSKASAIWISQALRFLIFH